MNNKKNKVSITVRNKKGEVVKGIGILKSIKWEIITLIIVCINSFHNYKLIGSILEFTLFSKLLYDHIDYLKNCKNKTKSGISSTGISINLNYIILIIIILILIYTCTNILNILF